MVLKFTDRQIAVSICAIAVIALCLNRSNGRTLRARQDEPLYPLSEDTDQSVNQRPKFTPYRHPILTPLVV